MSRKTTRWRSATVLAATVVVVTSACTGSPTASAPATSSAPAAVDTTSPLTIRQAVIPAVTNLLPLLAVDYADEFNLTIESTTAQNVQSEITAAQRGDIDVFPATPAGVITGRESNLPLVMLSGASTGSTQLLVGDGIDVAEGDWDALVDLVDERRDGGDPLRFGSAVAGSANFVECQQSLLGHGIEVGTDVELVTLANFPDHPAAIEQGEVDILCTPEPFATNAITAGGATFFATPYDTEIGDILGAIITTEDTLGAKRDELARYLQVLVYTAEQVRQDPQIAVDRVMELANTDEAGAQRMLEYTQFDLAVSEDAIAALATAMYELGQTSTDLSDSIDDWIDLSLLESAQAAS